MFQRIRTLWKVSGLEMEKQKYANKLTTVDGIKERLGLKKFATIVDITEREDMFDLKNKTL